MIQTQLKVNWQLLSEIHPNQSQIAKAYTVTTIAIVSNPQYGTLPPYKDMINGQ